MSRGAPGTGVVIGMLMVRRGDLRQQGRALSASVVVSSPFSVGSLANHDSRASFPYCVCGCDLLRLVERADRDRDAVGVDKRKVSGVPQFAAEAALDLVRALEDRKLPARHLEFLQAARQSTARRTSRTPSGTCGNGRYAGCPAAHAAHSAPRRTGTRRSCGNCSSRNGLQNPLPEGEGGCGAAG